MRDKSLNCENCDYWDKESERCRCYAPGASRAATQHTNLDAWIWTSKDKWCGEHSHWKVTQPTKNKVK